MVSQEPEVWEISSSSEDDDDDDLIFLSAKTISKRSHSEEVAVGNKKQRILEATDVDLDCFILEGDPCKIDSEELHKDDSMDLVVTGERVFVACRDYPHSRHLCAKYPFNSTPHEQHCPLCYCYVCDKLAPCVFWKNAGVLKGHCDASDKEKTWKSLRQMQTPLVMNNLRTDNQCQQVENRQTVRTNIRLANLCSGSRQLSGGSASSLISICSQSSSASANLSQEAAAFTSQGASSSANLSHEASAFPSEGLTINVPALSMGTVSATTVSSSVPGYLKHRIKLKGMPTNGFSGYQVPAPNMRQPTIPSASNWQSLSLAHLSQPQPLRHRPRASLIKPQAFTTQRPTRPLPNQSFRHNPTRIPRSAPLASVSHSPAAVTPSVADTRVPYLSAASSFPPLCVSYGQAGFLQNVDFQQQQQQMQPFPISSTGQGGVELPPLPLNDLAVQFDWSFLDGISDLASS